MDDLQSEKEQIEEMRAWWSEHGRYVISGVVVAVALLVGYNQYQSNKLQAQVQASELYETLADYIDQGDLADAENVASQLAADYANTAYAAQSKLAMARLYMDKNRDQDAADVLTELVDMRGNRELRSVGRSRLARVLLYQDKPQAVIDLLANEDEPAFAARYAESLGDAYAALGDVDQAAESYRVAMSDTVRTVNRRLVQMKLADLPSPDAEPEPVEPETESAMEPAPADGDGATDGGAVADGDSDDDGAPE